MGFSGGLFFLLLQVLFLTWSSCGWLFKFKQGRKLLVQRDRVLTACSLLHLLFFLVVSVFNLSHVVFPFYCWKFRLKFGSSRRSSLVRMPLSRACWCGFIQPRTCKRREKHDCTDEQRSICISCCLVAVLSHMVWQRAALFGIYPKLFGFVQLHPLRGTTAISKCPKGTVPPSSICQGY